MILGDFRQGRHEQRQGLADTSFVTSVDQRHKLETPQFGAPEKWGYERGRAAIPRRHWPRRDEEPLSRFFVPACARTMCGIGGSRRSPSGKEWFLMTAKCAAMMAAQCNCEWQLPKCPVSSPPTRHGPLRSVAAEATPARLQKKKKRKVGVVVAQHYRLAHQNSNASKEKWPAAGHARRSMRATNRMRE